MQDVTRAVRPRAPLGDPPEPFGERTPYAFDIEALASMVDAAAQYKQASHGDDILGRDTREKIDRVVATFCKQFRSTDNDGD